MRAKKKEKERELNSIGIDGENKYIVKELFSSLLFFYINNNIFLVKA